MSIYILLDTTDPNYSRLISELKDRAHANFTPVLNRAKTKALIQIKNSRPAYEKWMVDRGNSMLLGTGDVSWAKTEVGKAEWPNVTDDDVR